MNELKHFEITFKNGRHPLVYKCSTAHEAMGCIDDFLDGYGKDIYMNRDVIMKYLVDMAFGNTISHEQNGVRIRIVDGEV